MSAEVSVISDTNIIIFQNHAMEKSPAFCHLSDLQYLFFFFNF